MSPHELFVKLKQVNLYLIGKQLKVLDSQDDKSKWKIQFPQAHTIGNTAIRSNASHQTRLPRVKETF